MGISFIIPCYNESPEVLLSTIKTLQSTIKKLKDLEYEIIVIDDGSNLYSYRDVIAHDIIYLKNKINKGYGSAILKGITISKHDWIAITDSDGTYPNEMFEEMISYTPNYDMIIGKRSWKDISIIKIPAKIALQYLASFLSNKWISDLNSGMRIFKKDISLQFKRIFPEGFSFTSTLTMIFFCNGYEVKYIDIPYNKRIGKSKIHPVKDTLNFLSLILRLALYFKPLRIFIPLSLIFLSLGIARAIRDVYVANHFGNLSLTLFFISFQFFFFGLIAEIINKK